LLSLNPMFSYDDRCRHQSLTREDLGRVPRKRIKTAGAWFTPHVDLIELPTGPLILKDFCDSPSFIRNTLCRYIVRREVAMYERLAGLPFVPQNVAMIDDAAFVMEYLDALPLPSGERRDDVGMEFFERLRDAVNQMHERGVAHGDLRKRNVLIDAERRPYLIDFETAVADGRGFIRSMLFRKVARVDRITVLKLKRRYFRKEMSAEEREQFADKPFLLRAGQFYRKKIYRRIKFLLKRD
jgi:predicted Ser/Thr protein kinase